jgi:type IV secretory pathway VirB2 component (pilin)
MTDQLGRFGMAIAVISLIATGLYQFSGSVSVVETGTRVVVIHSPY